MHLAHGTAPLAGAAGLTVMHGAPPLPRPFSGLGWPSLMILLWLVCRGRGTHASSQSIGAKLRRLHPSCHDQSKYPHHTSGKAIHCYVSYSSEIGGLVQVSASGAI